MVAVFWVVSFFFFPILFGIWDKYDILVICIHIYIYNARNIVGCFSRGSHFLTLLALVSAILAPADPAVAHETYCRIGHCTTP